MYEKPRVNVKVKRGSTFTFTRGFSYITSILIYARKASSSLRAYARKNYATVEIHLNAKPSGTENPVGWGVKLEKTLRRGGYGYFLEPHIVKIMGSTYLQVRLT